MLDCREGKKKKSPAHDNRTTIDNRTSSIRLLLNAVWDLGWNLLTASISIEPLHDHRSLPYL